MSRVFSKLGVRSRRQLRDLKMSPAMLAAGAPATA
jgi:hypothetical protein